jgi:hypothetical protein
MTNQELEDALRWARIALADCEMRRAREVDGARRAKEHAIKEARRWKRYYRDLERNHGPGKRYSEDELRMHVRTALRRFVLLQQGLEDEPETMVMEYPVQMAIKTH